MAFRGRPNLGYSPHLYITAQGRQSKDEETYAMAVKLD